MPLTPDFSVAWGSHCDESHEGSQCHHQGTRVLRGPPGCLSQVPGTAAWCWGRGRGRDSQGFHSGAHAGQRHIRSRTVWAEGQHGSRSDVPTPVKVRAWAWASPKTDEKTRLWGASSLCEK